MTNFIQKLTLSVLLICTSLSVFSAQLPSNLSPQQIQQFQNLPKAQQQSLAASLGIDFNAIESQLNKSNAARKDEPVELEQYTPRKVNVESITEQVKEKNKKLKGFGYSVFANEPTSFAPINDVAIPEGYIIGTGDVLNIKIFGKENDEFEVPVSREGKVVLPKLGQYTLAGMTFSEAKSYLKNEIQKKIIGVEIVATLSELRSIRIFVLGEAYKPGSYLLNSLSTVTHAIFSAGGISDIGTLRNIQVKRAGKLVQQVDLYELLIKGDSSKDIMLKSGDVVFIEPVGDTVTVKGEVKRPAIYELKANETVGSALSMAGGLLPSAFGSSTIIERYNDKSLRSVINIDLSSSIDKSKKIKTGDVIQVMKSSDTFQESISIVGAVSRPGDFQWKKNQKISDLLPNIQSHILQDADLTYSLIVRQLGVGRDIEVLQFSLKNAIANYNSKDNLFLEPLDKVLVFSNKSEANENIEEVNRFSREKLLAPIIERLIEQSTSNHFVQIVDIAGAVKFPGTYPLPINGNIKDLILASGGLLESAFLENAELSRNEIGNNEANTQLISVDLQNVLDNSSDNITLKSRDRLNVNTIPYWQEEQVVSLSGEFKFPGKYIVRRGETLSQLIERAGGFTEYANLEATLFTRETLKALENKNLINVTEQLRGEIATKTLSQVDGQSIDYEQVNNLLNDLTKVKPIGRLVIDLPDVLSGNANNIIMESGDSIFVASKQNTVNVVGQVYVASSHLYKNGLNYTDYIKLSGGFKIQADEDRIYIIKANGAVQLPEGSNWFASDNNVIQPGDTVVVPLNTYYMRNISLWQAATQIIYQSAIAVAAITSL